MNDTISLWNKENYFVWFSKHLKIRAKERKVSLDIAFFLANTLAEKNILYYLPKMARFAVKYEQPSFTSGTTVFPGFDYTFIFVAQTTNGKPSIGICTTWNNEDGPFYFKQGLPVLKANKKGHNLSFSLTEEHELHRQDTIQEYVS